MTTLKRPVSRRTTLTLDNRRTARQQDQIVVTMYPDGTDRPAMLGFRRSRHKHEYLIPLESCFALAVRAEMLERAKFKKARRSKLC